MGKRYFYGLMTMALTLVPGIAHGFSPDRYAASSRLSQGRWAKIRVNETGMQLITNAQLRNLGFTDPSKVHVYGYGGRMISEVLDASHHDDLPLQPSVATAKGLVFYGTDRTSWSNLNTTGGNKYARTQNPYSLESYYLISDVAVDEVPMEILAQGTSASAPVTVFTAHLIHENELQAPSNSGRDIYGEDFRAQTAQTFPFTLTGNVGDKAKVGVYFGAATTNGRSYFNVTANGEAIPGTSQIGIDACTGATQYNFASSVSDVPVSDERLSVGVKYTPGGAVSMARLDYITVEYERALNMNGIADLHFYDTHTGIRSYTVAGCSASTVIWDVTDPGRPKLIQAVRDGDKMTFTAGASGYREYIAFDAEKVSRTVTPAGSVANQDIHAMPVPDMVIIAPAVYTEQARRVAALHEETDGWRVYVLTPETLYNEFSSATPEVSAFRKALKMWYDRGEQDGHRLSHCLIMSRPTYDNYGVSQAVRNLPYPRVPIWTDPSSQRNNKEYSYGTDDFISMLEDNSGANFGKEKISIATGRMPVKSVTEATRMVDKLEKYVRTPQYGAWRNHVVILADDEDRQVHYTQADDLYTGMTENGNGDSFLYKRIYMEAYQREASGRGMAYPVAKAELMQQINDGVGVWAYIGHGSPRGLTAEDMFNWTDLSSLTNRHPFIMYAATCEFLRWDDDDVSGAELVWLYPEAGSIGMMIATRSVLINANGYLTEQMGKNFYTRDSDGRPLTIGELLRRGKNDLIASSKVSSDTNRLRFAVMGDPALRLPSPTYTAVVDEINGYPVSGDAEFPQFGAGDLLKAKGHIEDAQGNRVDDFNGVLEGVLYDAEKVVELKPISGDESVYYNDRTNLLNKVREVVTAGEWSASIPVPSIIDNNYSPAMFNMYAYSDDGKEANGNCTSLYLYGEGSQTSADDTTGPEITLLALNSESFSPGDIVNESPVVIARMRDDSGLNIYGGIIGHQLSISIDGKTYTGVSDYYTPDLGDPCAGSILFPLDNIEPGEHELSLTVYDNADNFTTASVPFRVAVGRAPGITDITTDVNPATTAVNFILTHNRPSETLQCLIEVFDLSGRKVWSTDASTSGQYDATMRVAWDLCDGNGSRVPRGIYLYRATVTDKDGSSSSRTRKLAVTAR